MRLRAADGEHGVGSMWRLRECGRSRSAPGGEQRDPVLRRRVRGGRVEPVIKRQPAAAAAVAADAVHAAQGPRDDGEEDEPEELERHANTRCHRAGHE